MKFKKVLLIVFIIILLILVFYFFWIKSKPEAVYCPQDAKLCPDGSYVGRTGPNCEFAPCSPSLNYDL